MSPKTASETMEPIRTKVAVVGLGAMGAATLYQLAKRGVDALGIDRFVPPHTKGSSHGGSRVTREAVGEGPAYVPLARRSHQIIADLESEFGETLLVKSGTLIVGSPSSGATPLHGANDFLASSIEMADRFGIPYELMDAAELRRRYPQFKAFRDTDRGYLEPGSGYIRPEALIKTQIDAARGLGAGVLTDTVAERISQEGDAVRIETADGNTVVADRVVVCAGAWARKLLGPPFTDILTVTRQVLYWYEIDDHAPFAPDRFPTFIWFVTDKLEDYFTGFPVTDPSEGVKMVASREAPDIDHETVGPLADPGEAETFYERHVGPNIVGTRPAVVNTGTCFYTNTPDNGFILDDHPEMDRVFVVSACSGHGFKHSAAIGEAVAQRVHEGRSEIDLSAFALKRFLDENGDARR